jgi:hypothetical protein
VDVTADDRENIHLLVLVEIYLAGEDDRIDHFALSDRVKRQRVEQGVRDDIGGFIAQDIFIIFMTGGKKECNDERKEYYSHGLLIDD